jgi:formylglycine-generating enzyme required for sulfatase activity
MSNPAALLELIGQAVLPALADPAGAIDGPALARDIWSSWGRGPEAATRRADLEELHSCADEAFRSVQADVVRRLLPGRAGPIQAALVRYLAALPSCLRRTPVLAPHTADDLLRWLPGRLPRFQSGDRPAGVGDRELLEPVRLAAGLECWLARNPHLPALPDVLLAFLDERDRARAAIDWHRRLREQGNPTGPASLEHTFLDAQPPCLQFAGPGTSGLAAALREPGPAHSSLFRQIVELLARLHRLPAPLVAGRIAPGDVLLGPDGPRLLVADPGGAEGATTRDDVKHLGRLGRALLGEPGEALSALLAECLASDPLSRPMDAAALLERLRPLPPATTEPPATTASTPATGHTAHPPPARTGPRPRRGSDMWKVLDTIQKSEPELAKLVTNTIGMKFVLVPAGSFHMGSPPGEAGRRDNEGPVHEVILTGPFYLGVHPVTQAQYQAVLGKNPARFQGAAGGGADHPVEMVSWDDAVSFCKKLSELPAEQQAGRSYRLPTEAEWEYACRAGSQTPFHHGAALGAASACFDASYPYGDAPRGARAPRTCQVGAFAANHFGLYDMHGNVWEWCADWFDADYYRNSPRQDPPGPASGNFRVLRGGSFCNQGSTCRAAYRNALVPNQQKPFIGFRVVLVQRPAVSEN